MDNVNLDHVREAAHYVSKHLELDTKPRPKAAVIMGSGLGSFAEKIKCGAKSKAISFGDIPHFSSSTVEGHKGEFVYGYVDDDAPVLALNGRLHLYEGLHPQAVTMPIRVFGLLGIEVLVITNAAGAVADGYEPGELMVIADHINLTGGSPLVGKNCAELGPRFLDLSVAYDHELRILAKQAAIKADIKMHEGVYACVLGPCYETPAEVRMLKGMGVDATGMSTVFETIVARHMGLKVLAISCLTNKAAGLSSQKITHEEVMENNAKVGAKLGQIITDVVRKLP